jgi:hypothetical protein
MAIMIGGPLHKKILDVTMKYVYVPVTPTENHPKQDYKYGLPQCTYERTNFIRENQRVYRFKNGYYDLLAEV